MVSLWGSGTTSSSGGQHFPAGVLAKLAIAAYVCAGVNPWVDPWEDLADGDILDLALLSARDDLERLVRGG
jgi:hypothetical protein